MKCCVMEGGVVLYNRYVCICVKCLHCGNDYTLQHHPPQHNTSYRFHFTGQKTTGSVTQSDLLIMGVKTPKTC